MSAEVHTIESPCFSNAWEAPGLSGCDTLYTGPHPDAEVTLSVSSAALGVYESG